MWQFGMGLRIAGYRLYRVPPGVLYKMVIKRKYVLATLALITFIFVADYVTVQAAQSSTAESVIHAVGVIQSIQGNNLVIKTDKNVAINVTLTQDISLLRISPNQVNLDNAHPISLTNIQAGDRVLVHGNSGPQPNTLVAFRVIVIKEADLAEKQAAEREQWQKHGAGGLVSAVDPGARTFTLSGTAGHATLIRTDATTRFLRYSRTSENFADAQDGTFDAIHIGDQLRALGSLNTDTNTVDARVVVSGSFRNIAGVILSSNTIDHSLVVRDLISKKEIMVKVTDATQLRRLPDFAATGLAGIVKLNEAKTSGGAAPGHRMPDLARILEHAPATTLGDLHKGDALMIVGTSDTDPAATTAITVLSGVEPILTASPNGSGAASLLSGWNVSAAAP